MSNHPITPLASSQINHDHLKVELVEPDAMPPWCASFGRHNQQWWIRNVSQTLQPRSRNCSRGRTSCSPGLRRTASEPVI
jgi:hypothetical protein